MSAILSADDLNDFISPGVACIKPIETLPQEQEDNSNPYEVTTEDKVAAANPPPAQISLTDCLACSGCVTSAEAVLVSLQSHLEVLNTLDAYPSLPLPQLSQQQTNRHASETYEDTNLASNGGEGGKIFIATISPQSRASLAALLGESSETAGHVISQLLAGTEGLATGGQHRSHFSLVLDSNVFRDVALVMAAEEVLTANTQELKKPILTSACPGWICYAEKTHPHILPHLSGLKSPQALAGTMLKSLLWRKYNIEPSRVWHLAVMPCFDKKLEASRAELHSDNWDNSQGPVRDVDCVITVRELLTMAESRGLDITRLPRRPVKRARFSEPELDEFLFPRGKRKKLMEANGGEEAAGTSGGYLWHVLQTARASYPGSIVEVERGRNADVVEYRLVSGGEGSSKQILLKVAKYYGFRNIQNLVRRLRPHRASRLPGAAARRAVGPSSVQPATDYAYVEVMACPSGCTNGGGQIKATDHAVLGGTTITDQRSWLAQMDEAYWSASGDSAGESENVDNEVNLLGSCASVDVDKEDTINGISPSYVHRTLQMWSEMTGIDPDRLCHTTYRAVESDVGKNKAKGKSDMERVAGLAVQVGGGW